MIAQHFRIVACVLLIAICGCTQKKENRMELRVHIPDVKIQTDPQKMEDAYSMMIALQLYRGLLRYNESGDVKDDIAQSWTQSPDNLTYSFKLKKASFSDGTPITAQNVQMSFARLFYLGSSMAADIDYIAGAEDFKKTWDISKFGIKVISPSELEIKLSHPSAIFLKQVAVVDCSILPINDFRKNPSTTAFSGPYKLVSSSDSEFNLEKWRSDSFDSPRPPEKIQFFKSAESPENLAREGRTDSLDYDEISYSATTELRSKGWSGDASELTWEIFVILNPKYVPLEARRETYQKTNAKELVKFLGVSQFVPAYGLIPNGFGGTLFENDVADFTKTPHVYKGKKIAFKLDYLADSQFDLKLARWLKEKWDSKNIEVVLNPIKRGEKLTRMFSKTAEATIGKKGTDYPDGYSVLTYFKGKYESNYFHVNDPKIDAAISAASREFDSTKRAGLYKEVQRNILSHYTNIPLYFGSQASGLWSSKVAVIPSHPLGAHTMPFESIEVKAQ